MKHAILMLASLVMTFTITQKTSAEALLSIDRLAQTDPVYLVVTEIGEQWHEGNISTGTTAASAAQIKSALPTKASAWKQLALEFFKLQFKGRIGEPLPASAKVRISSYPMNAKSLTAAVAAVAESNAYDTSNPETMASLRAETSKMIAALGSAKDIHFLALKTRLEDESSESKRNIRLHLFVNVKNGKTLAIFTVEGTM